MCSYYKYKIILIHYFAKHIPPLNIWRDLEQLKLNEPGRQKLSNVLEADVAESPPVSCNSTQMH